MKSSLSFAKAWFAVSLLVLAFGYGFASHAWGLFPKTFVERAWRQAYWRNTNTLEGAYSHEKVYEKEGTQVLKPEKVRSGMTAITSWWKTSEGPRVGIKLVGRKGDILHEWFVDREETFGGNLLQRRDPGDTDIHGSVLLPNGDVVINLGYVGMARLNSCRKVQWTLTEGNHHSIVQDENGSFWVPGVSQETRTGTEEHPDFSDLGSVWLDRILHVGEGGKILEDIKVLDILYQNDLERFLFQYTQTEGDVTHINDVEPLHSSIAGEYPLFEAGDLVVSLRPINLVFVFDPETMEVKWHASGPFIGQHDPDFIGDGWIGVLDNNRGWSEEGSRIIAFQPHTDSMKTLFQGKHLDRFYTHHRGKWQMLENGNMLLTEEEAGRAVEVTSEGNPVWEWVHEPYDSKVSSVTKATRHDLTRQQVASWSCSSVDSVSTPQKQQTAP